MKRIVEVVLLVFISVLVICSTALAQPDGEPVVIIPYLSDPPIPEIIYSNQEVILGARWGACSFGLSQASPSAIRLDWTVDGNPLFQSPREVRQYWSPSMTRDIGNIPCLLGDGEVLWLRHWEYSLGELAPGDYEIRLLYWLSHPLIDGGDYDGDGLLDVFDGALVDVTVSVHVEDPPPD